MRQRVEKSVRFAMPDSVSITDFQRIDPRRYRFSKNVPSNVFWFKKHKTPRRAYRALKLSVYYKKYVNRKVMKEWQKKKNYFMKKKSLKSGKKMWPRHSANDFLTDEVRELIRLYETPTPITEEEFEQMISMTEEEMRQRNLDISLPEAQEQAAQQRILDVQEERFDTTRPGIDRDDIIHKISEMWPELLEKLEPRRTNSAPPSIKVTDSAVEPRRRLSDAENINPIGPMVARLAINRPRNVLQEIQLVEDSDQLPQFQFTTDKPLDFPQPDAPQPPMVQEGHLVREPELEFASMQPDQQGLIPPPVDLDPSEQEVEPPLAPPVAPQEHVQELDVPEVVVSQRQTRSQNRRTLVTQAVEAEVQPAQRQELPTVQVDQELQIIQEQPDPPVQRPARGRGRDRARNNRNKKNQRRGSRDRTEPEDRDEFPQDFETTDTNLLEIIDLMQEWLILELPVQPNAQPELPIQPEEPEIPSLQQQEAQPRESLPSLIRSRLSRLPTSFSVESVHLPPEANGRVALIPDSPLDLPEIQMPMNAPMIDDILPGVPIPVPPVDVVEELIGPPQALQPQALPQLSAPEMHVLEQSSERPSDVRGRQYLSLPRQMLTASGTFHDNQSISMPPQQLTIQAPTMIGISEPNLDFVPQMVPQQLRASVPRTVGSTTSTLSNVSELHPINTEVDDKLKMAYLIYLKLSLIKTETQRREVTFEQLTVGKQQLECVEIFAALLELQRDNLIEIISGPIGRIISIRF